VSKVFLGPRVRFLREQRGWTQSIVARALNVSPSYYSQLESNQRPMTPALIANITQLFGLDSALFSEEEEGRLVADMREALSSCGPDEQIGIAESREVVSNMPQLARALIALHRRYRAAAERADALSGPVGGRTAEDAVVMPLQPYEEVRDFFYARHNYVAELDELAERVADEDRIGPGEMTTRISERLLSKHGVRVVAMAPDTSDDSVQRRFDKQTKQLFLASHLLPGQRAFQLATQLAQIEAGGLIASLVAGASFTSDESQRLARIGLAHHFAGALLMPYRRFLEAAEALQYDIDRLRRLFSVSYETTCHRLSTLQRPDAKGVPFFFMRVDRAGNISKRQSATDFHFSRVGGTCPLWNVYEAFAQPGKILRQVAQMPDGRTYLWIARAVSRSQGSFGTPDKTYAIGLGCDVQHASRLVYARGLAFNDPAAATPIGMGCKVCERKRCPQRAFPPIGRPISVDEAVSRFEPYRSE
jgi:predicted transcriptional regulator/transcriptional regulator with XRE-family HTH domain